MYIDFEFLNANGALPPLHNFKTIVGIAVLRMTGNLKCFLKLWSLNYMYQK